VVWNEEGATGSRRLFITVSSDTGATWSNAFSVADNGTTGPWPDPAPAYDTNNDLWIAHRTAGTLAGERSLSLMRLGQSSNTAAFVVVGGAIDVREPAIAAGPGGLLLLAWSQVPTAAPGGTRTDVWSIRSTDLGVTWNWPGRRSLPGTTTDGAGAPDLAVNPNGGAAVVVFRTETTAPCG